MKTLKVKEPGVKLQEEMWRQRHIELAEQFEHYILEHPELLGQMPDEAIICMQVEGDEAFNSWSRRWIKRVAKGEENPVVYVHIKRLKPFRSRIEEVVLEKSAK